jgi:DNA-binding MarR family transcriptional regulator
LTAKGTRSKNAITRAVDSLERLGFTKSNGTKQDRRLRKVSVTEKGLDIVEKTMDLRHRIGSQVMQCLNDDSAAALQRILKQLRSHVQHLKDGRRSIT